MVLVDAACRHRADLEPVFAAARPASFSDPIDRTAQRLSFSAFLVNAGNLPNISSTTALIRFRSFPNLNQFAASAAGPDSRSESMAEIAHGPRKRTAAWADSTPGDAEHDTSRSIPSFLVLLA
ncbi:hypothetical protein [Saccharopolyspora sp. 5N708]|uniref:hypothetical protein n=1 Tax=Saccharopolyspora sp. 5N708 TaxID=3457424 RepID=UPI003FD66E59